ncbi:uncharacterized protein LOC127860630 isoform X2 [Dreissena polymorpha]|uniref:Uncharacterized protein n=2 Tax=Dreissena polymorpha TaxID=45954 RepID=A0A9D4BNR8_DREPO|nr:uncharacterized protein LOC127860630 isoform X2 [Dreissena polymorpha]KAH3702919.1 hypothetical protein DPMN_077947 [Dreissena polymorpha]
MSKSENRDDDNHITLSKVESKPTAFYEFPVAPASNQTYDGGLQNASTSIKDAVKYYTKVDNGYANAESKHIDLYHAPYDPVVNHSHSGLDTGNTKSKEHEASAATDVTHQNTTTTHGNHDSDTHAYFVLEKDGFEKQRNTIRTISLDAHDNFVLEKQQPNIGNNNGVSTNEVHPYFLLEKEGAQPVHDIHKKQANPYFVLEIQNTGNATPISTANVLQLDNDDGDMYQEIDTNDTYAGIDDSREDNNDYDYTNKAFRDSKMEISDNVYNHLNSVGDEYDHVGKGQNNVKAMENNYDIMPSAVRK